MISLVKAKKFHTSQTGVWHFLWIYFMAAGITMGILLSILLSLKKQGVAIDNGLFDLLNLYIGPLYPVSILFVAILIWSSVLLGFDLLGMYRPDVALHFSMLHYIQVAGPLFGLLITFLSLMQVQLNLDITLSQQEVLSSLAVSNGRAYGSTIAGAAAALIAFSVKTFYGILNGNKGGDHDDEGF